MAHFYGPSELGLHDKVRQPGYFYKKMLQNCKNSAISVLLIVGVRGKGYRSVCFGNIPSSRTSLFQITAGLDARGAANNFSTLGRGAKCQKTDGKGRGQMPRGPLGVLLSLPLNQCPELMPCSLCPYYATAGSYIFLAITYLFERGFWTPERVI